MAEGKVDAVIVGADRIAANGDTANKVGTLGLAIDVYKRQFLDCSDCRVPLCSLSRVFFLLRFLSAIVSGE